MGSLSELTGHLSIVSDPAEDPDVMHDLRLALDMELDDHDLFDVIDDVHPAAASDERDPGPSPPHNAASDDAVQQLRLLADGQRRAIADLTKQVPSCNI